MSNVGKGNKNTARNNGKAECRKGSNSQPKTKKYVPKKDEADKNYGKGPASNDAAWYALSPRLLENAASISWHRPTGSAIGGKNVKFNHDLTPYSLPGVITLNVRTCPGVSTDGNSALNTASRNLYTFVRHANSGHSNYNSPDLMLYLLAVDQVYAFICNAQRLYGIMNVFAQENRYYPKHIVRALGFDYDDMLSNLANFKFWINSFVLKAGSLCVPGGFSVYLRHSFMFQNVYMDEPSAKAQSYAFVPEGFYVYDETTNPQGGQLTWSELSGTGTPITFNALRAFGDSLLNPLLESEDLAIMGGDILKAYGVDALYKTSTIPDDYVTVPVHDVEVLDQIHNCIIIPKHYNVTDMDITQNVNLNCLLYNPTLEDLLNERVVNSENVLCSSPTVTLYHDDITPGDTMVCTRLMPTLKPISGQDYKYHFESVGSEFIHGADFWWLHTDGTVVRRDLNPDQHVKLPVSGVINGVALHDFLMKITALVQFKYAPRMFITYFYETSSGWVKTWFQPIWDVANWSNIDPYVAKNMDDTALLSMFNVPLMGSNDR